MKVGVARGGLEMTIIDRHLLFQTMIVHINNLHLKFCINKFKYGFKEKFTADFNTLVTIVFTNKLFVFFPSKYTRLLTN